MAEDIEDELVAQGAPLSLRAARYIRIKRRTEEGLRAELARLRGPREPPHCPTCGCCIEHKEPPHGR